MSTRNRLRAATIAAATATLAFGAAWHSTALAAAHSKGVTVVLSEEPDIVEPCQSSRSNIGRVVKQNIVETLTEIDPATGDITPRLATSWSQVDPLTWRFELRQGVKFHDGADFDARAAAYGIDRTMDKNLDCEVRTKFFGGMSVSAIPAGTHTLDIKTDQAGADPAHDDGHRHADVAEHADGQAVAQARRHGPLPVPAVDGRQADRPGAQRRLLGAARPPVSSAPPTCGAPSRPCAPPWSRRARPTSRRTSRCRTRPTRRMDVSYPNSETSRLRIDVTARRSNDVRIRQALNSPSTATRIRGTDPQQGRHPRDPARGAEHQRPQPCPEGVGVRSGRPAQLPDRRGQGRRRAGRTEEITLLGRINIYPNGDRDHGSDDGDVAGRAGFKVKLQHAGGRRMAQHPDQALTPRIAKPVLLQAQHDNNNGDAVFTVYNKYHSSGAQSTIGQANLDKIIEAAGRRAAPSGASCSRTPFASSTRRSSPTWPMYTWSATRAWVRGSGSSPRSRPTATADRAHEAQVRTGR